MRNDKRSLQKAVAQVLRRQWDPIGVGDVPQALDEYDSYVPLVMRSIALNASALDLANLLLKIETDEMGLPGDRARALAVAAALLSPALLRAI